MPDRRASHKRTLKSENPNLFEFNNVFIMFFKKAGTLENKKSFSRGAGRALVYHV